MKLYLKKKNLSCNRYSNGSVISYNLMHLNCYYCRALILLATDKSGDNSYGYLYSFLLLSAILGKSIFGPNHQQKTHEAMMRSWTALTIAIYKKVSGLRIYYTSNTAGDLSKQELLTLSEHLGSLLFFMGSLLLTFLVFCVVFLCHVR